MTVLLIILFITGIIIFSCMAITASNEVEEKEVYVPFKELLLEEKELKLEPVKMVQFCQCCGAPVSFKGMKCEYCGVEYLKVKIYK